MLAALVADIALLPVTPSPLDLMAAKQALELMREAQRQRGGKRPVIAFIPSKVVQSTTLGRDLPNNLKPSARRSCLGSVSASRWPKPCSRV
jgi:chromosome partitioning protein